MDFSWERPSSALGRLVEGDGYRFQFHLRPGRSGWLDRGSPPEAVLGARREVLAGAWDRAVIWGAGADECWRGLESILGDGLRQAAEDGGTEPVERAVRVAAEWAPDFLLLRREGEEYRLAGGVVCFPSGWDPVEKLGQTVTEIHGAVPGLNEALAERIRRFLSGLRPGQVFERENWGLAATGELDLHPALGRPRLGLGTTDVWFRLEEQAFIGLEGGESLLFLIHVRTWPLHEVIKATGAGDGFERMFRTMPAEVAAYKGLTAWLAGRGDA